MRQSLAHLILTGVLATMSSTISAAGVPLVPDLSTANDMDIRALGNGTYEIETTGGDPYVMCEPVEPAYTADQHVLAFDYFCARGLSDFELFFGPPIMADHAAPGPAVPSSEGWTSYSMDLLEFQKGTSWRLGYTQFRLDFGRHPGRQLQIRGIQLREPTEYERKLARERVARARQRLAFEGALQAATSAVYPAAITGVEVDEDSVAIRIGLLAEPDDLVLCEVPFWQTHVGRTDFVWHTPLPEHAAGKEIGLPRVRKTPTGTHDRLYSSWVIARRTADGLVPVSHARFPDAIPAQWKLTRDRPASKKGTTGMHGGHRMQYDDYKTLGIHNCTKNIVLHAIIGTTPDDDTVPHTFNGRTYHVRRRALEGLDRAMREMDELGIVVSAIILIGKNTPMTHPDCSPKGIWAMPDVVGEDGWNLYAAGLDVLAERYLRPDRKYGRITHWIMHNEVDAGWVWTNAGEKPLHSYLDLYYRSMRTAQAIVRSRGHAGQVLISLTHYWTRAHNHLCYKPRDMLDLLQMRSRLEGDFDWGLAYHPYPQNLRNPRTWEDTQATFSFDTKLITPRNLEVLDAYMRQPRMLHNGQPRTILLSEQGSNSPDHSEKSYRDQAAGLVYTWLKFEPLDSIEAYVHHRWMDVTPGGEGGLLLGFWTNLPDRTPRHTKKPAWEMYRVLGTDEQHKAVESARQVIPEAALRDIPYTGPID